jgi:alpha-glucoside transport system substrate-binding protein
LKVFLMGRVAVETDRAAIEEAHFPGRQGRLLFAYLVAEQGRPVSRDELAEALWGETLPATWEKALSVLVSKLRSLLAGDGVDSINVLTAAFGCYGLALPEGTWVDVAAAVNAAQEAEDALAGGELEPAKAQAREAASLLQQPFLPGEEGAWVEEKRRELADVRVRALATMADACLRSGQPAEAAGFAEQVVALQPFRESGYRRLMEAHAAAGNRAEALQVYEQCRRLLAEELGAYPSPETEGIYRDLLAAPARTDAGPLDKGPRPGRPNPAAPPRVGDKVDATPERRRRKPMLASVAIALILAAVLSAVLVREVFDPASGAPETITFDGVWTGADRVGFEKVIAAFNRVHPEIKVEYKALGTNITTAVAKAVADGEPPDMADLPQPGFVKGLALQGRLKPITYAKRTIARNFAPIWQRLGTYNGKLYALVFKAANKSLLWYNVPAFRDARATPPKTWLQLLADAKLLDASGVPAYSIGAADGWTLTDLFENIYLRMYGPEKYVALSAHTIRWTDPSVSHALQTMAGVIGDRSSLAGGTVGALRRDFSASVKNAFSKHPKAAMVFEGDFVARQILSLPPTKRATAFGAVPFPTISPGAEPTAVEIGGDLIVTFRDTPMIEAFVKFLATAPAAEAWARLGGFGTGNLNVPPSAYPDASMRATELSLGTAQSVVFDMSDEQPPSFGSTDGQGEWAIFQQFLADPANADRIAGELEAAATAAYRKGR